LCFVEGRKFPRGGVVLIGAIAEDLEESELGGVFLTVG